MELFGVKSAQCKSNCIILNRGDILMTDKQELLEKLRIARETKGLSYQDIVDITEENGEAVSLSTVKRIFQKGSDLNDFRYRSTVRPIIRAVLGLDEETEAPAEIPSAQQAEEYFATIEGLKAVVEMKHNDLEAANKECEKLRNELAVTKHLVEEYRSDKRWYRRVVIVLGIIVALAIVALIIDLCAGHVGWIRY